MYRYGGNFSGNAGSVNTGGGGGGATSNGANHGLGGAGGSGIAIFRVPLSADLFTTTGTVEKVVIGNYVYYNFKSTGTLTL
jgi:hypothetical protein